MAENDDDTELQIEIEKDDEAGPEVELKAERPDKPEPKDDEPASDAAIEVLTRQRDALENRVATSERTIEQERVDNARRVAEANVQTLANAITATTAELGDMRRSFKEAMEGGDYDKAAELQEQLAVKAVERNALERGKDNLEQQLKAPQPAAASDPVEAMIAGSARAGSPLSARAQGWLKSHPEVAKKQSLASKVGWLHQEAVENGHAVDSDDYYKFLDERMGFADPAKDDAAPAAKPNGSAGEPKSAPAPRRAKPVSAPVSRDAGPASGNLSDTKIKLTAGEARAATDGTHIWNYDDPTGKGRFKKGDPIGVQEFARRKIKLTQQGAYDRIQTAQ